MRTNPLRSLVTGGRTIVGGWLTTESRYLAEVMSHAGFDAVTVDLQHGMFGIDTAIGLLQAVSAGPATPLARCASHDPAVIGKLLDAGAYGIICPDVGSAAEAAAFVAACRYPPIGHRSFGPSRGLLYGGPDYLEHADSEVLTWAMIESAEALASLDAILAVSGLNVYVGPNDLALSIGEKAGQSPVPASVRAALEIIVVAAHAAGRWAGAFSADGPSGRELVELGYDFVTPGNDVAQIRAVTADRIRTVRG